MNVIRRILGAGAPPDRVEGSDGGPSTGELARRLVGPLLTLALIGVIGALPLPRMPSLSLLLMLAISFAVLVSGVGPGIVSGVISVAFVTYYFRAPGASLRYSASNLERLIIFVLATPLVIATLGALRRRLAELLVRERDLRRQAESERERALNILESITDGCFALDHRWRYTYVNGQAEQLVGRTREDLLGKVVWEAFPALLGTAWDREYHRAVEQQVPVHFEAIYQPLDTWFETHAYPSEDGLTIYLRSISERKRADEALRARARQQAAVAELGQRALLGGDLRPLLEDAVHKLAATLEVELTKVLELLPDRQELVMRAGVGWKEGDHRVTADERSQAGYTLASQAPVVVEDLPSERRFQGPRLLVDHGVVSGMSVIIGGHGRPFGILGAHTRKKRVFREDDVHFLQAVANVLAEAIERKRAEAALAESEERFRQLAENVREVFYIIAIAPVQVLYINPAYETVWGRPRADLHARPDAWLDGVHPDDRPAVRESLPVRYAGFLEQEYRIVLPEGAIRWIRDRSTPVLDEGGHPYRVVGIAEDVTDRREAAEAARRLAASEASVRARDEVLAVVAHDLRNPLSAISLAAAQLEKPEVPAEKRVQRARTIGRAAGTADRLIRDLLDVARIEANQLTIEPRSLDVASAAREACEGVSQAAAEKSITLECSIAADVPPAFGDRDRVLQALGNLLGNALKFTPAGGRILLRAQRCPDGIELSVEDTGAGIPAEALPHVFDRFWRACPTDRRGLGLGLAIVKGIVSAHRGRVWAESEMGRRTVFHFTLPVEPSRAPGEPAQAPAGP